MECKSIVQAKSLKLSFRFAKLHKYLVKQKHEFVMSKQLLRSGTSIGANVTEAEYAISHTDFIAKLYIALKECGESLYWLEVLRHADYLTEAQFISISTDCVEVQKILTAILNTARENEEKQKQANIEKKGKV